MKDDTREVPRDLRERTTAFALRIVRMYCTLPKSTEAQVLGKQVLRSGTSVGAHYREASRARSKKEFVSKLEGGLAELDETDYWLELPAKAEIVNADRLQPLRNETNELLRIFATSIRTAKDKSEVRRLNNQPLHPSAFILLPCLSGGKSTDDKRNLYRQFPVFDQFSNRAERFSTLAG